MSVMIIVKSVNMEIDPNITVNCSCAAVELNQGNVSTILITGSTTEQNDYNREWVNGSDLLSPLVDRCFCHVPCTD